VITNVDKSKNATAGSTYDSDNRKTKKYVENFGGKVSYKGATRRTKNEMGK
jgi:hypothetical protein